MPSEQLPDDTDGRSLLETGQADDPERQIPIGCYVQEDGSLGATAQMPLVEVLTGRGFLTGKSGAGKSSSAKVIIEELCERNRPFAVIDPDGEYFGLKEEYRVAHVGGDDQAEQIVAPEHAEKLAEFALVENVPLIIDTSAFFEETATELVSAFTKELFALAKEHKKPFPLFVEEVHEFIPQKGSLSEVGKRLIKIGKRGRKHGLGIVGISQRPANVTKDFITQCEWISWHRLTWKNDTKVVKGQINSEAADLVEELADGEALLTADWESARYRRVQFRYQRTYDAGSRPGLDESETTPDLQAGNSELFAELEAVSDRQSSLEDERDRYKRLYEEESEKRAKLEEELEARSAAADEFADTADAFATAVEDALSDLSISASASTDGSLEGDLNLERISADVLEVVREEAADTLEQHQERVEELKQQRADLKATIEQQETRIAELEAELNDHDETLAEARADLADTKQRLDTVVDAYRLLEQAVPETDDTTREGESTGDRGPDSTEKNAAEQRVVGGGDGTEPAEAAADAQEAPGEATVQDGDTARLIDYQQGEITDSYNAMLDADRVSTAVDKALSDVSLSSERGWEVLVTLAAISDDNHPIYADADGQRPDAKALATEVQLERSSIYKITKRLVDVGLIDKIETDPTGSAGYRLATDEIERLVHATRTHEELKQRVDTLTSGSPSQEEPTVD